MTETVLEKYNQVAQTHLTAINELEEICKLLREETVEETPTDAIFRRIYACCIKDSQDVFCPFCFYRLDTAICDTDGDVVATVPFEYGML